jgi:hypothetical protein
MTASLSMRRRARRSTSRLDSQGRITEKYYLACSYPLEVGSVVLPGNWGRIVGMYNTSGFGNAWVQYRDASVASSRTAESASQLPPKKQILRLDQLGSV